MNVADWFGSSVVLDPEHEPEGVLSDWHVGPLARLPAGALWVSATLTPFNVTLLVFVTTKV